MLRLIAFSGLPGTGKTTVANKLASLDGWRVFHFAETLKKMLAVFGLDERDLYGDVKEVPHPLLCGKTPRHAMQTLGTEWGRDCIGPSLWTNICMAKVKKYLSLDKRHKVLIDDMRFLDEAEAVKAFGGACVLVNAMKRLEVPEENDHRSNTELLDIEYDYVFYNNHSLGDIPGKLADMLDTLELDRLPKGD